MTFAHSLTSVVRRAEARVAGALRSRVARVLGSVVAIAAMAALASRLLENPNSTIHALGEVGVGGLFLAAFGLVGFHIAAIKCLATLELARAPQIWTQAQLLKYLPIPASAVAGFLGSAVQHGHTARQALRALLLHTLVLILGATAVAAGVLVPHAARLGSVRVALILIAGTLVVSAGAHAVTRSAGVPPRAFLFSLAAWSSVGLGFGIGLGDQPNEWLIVGSAYAAAWVVGQLAIPVPAGLGVREAAFVILVAPTLGETQALVAALLARLLHALSDGGAAIAVGLIGRWRRRVASSMGPDR